MSTTRKMSIRTAIGATLATVGLIAAGSAAYAASVNGTTEISCNGTTYEYIRSVDHSPSGAMTFWADDANPASITRVTAESSGGNWLPSRLVSEGSYGAWSGVAASTYDFHAKRSTSYNCNGPWYGNGNYTLKYTIVYQ